MPASRATGFDGMEELRIPAGERDVLLPEPAALRQEDEDANERDEQTRAGDAGNREHKPDHDQRNGRRPSRDPLRESVDVYPGDSNASVA